ncbi:hypothetical protein V3C99_011351 [Haemonchus contortus]
MGFYDEEETFGEVTEDKPMCSDEPEAKRKRLNESVPPVEDAENPTLASVLKAEMADDDDEEEERDPEEKAARHEVLRRVGLKTKPTNALRRYLKKVVAGAELNPWVSTVYTEKALRKKLRCLVVAMLIKACKNEGVEECEFDKSHEAAIKFIDRLNEEIVESLSILGNFSSDLIRCARSNCQKAFLPNHVAHTLVSRIPGDYSHCQVPECPHALGTHDDVNYLIIEGGSYSERFEMPNNDESPSKLLCLCYFHNGIFEFMFDIIHMKWNIYHNCLIHVKEVLKNKKFKVSDEVIEELPSDVIRSLVHYYMARYFCLWVFGEKEQWSKNGCTLFQVLYGMDGQVG